MHQNFKWHVPVGLIKSGVDKAGNPVLKMGGIASTASEDADGDIILPEGVDPQYLLDYGHVNWNHLSHKDPSAIIGYPVKAEHTQKGVYVECELYADSDLAQKVYTLAQTLEKNSSPRKLGFSIEGKAITRDKVNPKIVSKSILTGLAITPTPKNTDTEATILKSYVSFDDDPVVEQSEPANGGDGYIIDVDTGSYRVTVDKSYHIKVQKSLNTTSGAPLIRESVDGSVKNMKNRGHKSVDSMTKSQTFNRILKHCDYDLIKGHLFFRLAQQNSMNTTSTISREDLTKALTALGVPPSEIDGIVENTIANSLIKGAGEMGNEGVSNMAAQGSAANGGEESKLSKRMDNFEEEMAKMNKSLGKILKAMSNDEEDEDEEGEGDEGMEKATDLAVLENRLKKGAALTKEENLALIGEENTLTKAAADPTADLVKGITDQLKLVQEQLSEQITSLKDEFEERLEEVENTPQMRKSVGAGAVRRFRPSENQSTQLHLRGDRDQVIALLSKAAGVDELEMGGQLNEKYANALQMFESSGFLPNWAVNDLQKSHNVQLVN